MKRLLPLLNKLVINLFIGVGLLSYTAYGIADELYDSPGGRDYGYHAMVERREEQDRKIELQRYQEREYLLQQKFINQQDMHNQIYQKSRKLSARFSSEGMQ
jgi:hypothetical protein